MPGDGRISNRGNHSCGAEGGSDGTDAACPENRFGLARCWTVADEYSQRTAADRTGDVLDGFANGGGIVDGGVAQDRLGTVYRGKEGAEPVAMTSWS